MQPCFICRTSSTPEILPGLNRTRETQKPVAETVQVVCDKCGAAGPRARNEKQAVDLWDELNSRDLHLPI